MHLNNNNLNNTIMRKILSIVWAVFMLPAIGMASNWDGPMGIFLKTNTGSKAEDIVSVNYRITSTDWGNNGYSAPINGTSELNGVDLGVIASLKLDGGIYVGGTNDDNYPHHWYDENSFTLQYCVYRQGDETPNWDGCQELALNNWATDEYSGSNRNYVFNATDKSINLIALTNGTAGTYVLRVRMHKVKHYWNEDSSNGTWTEDTEPQEATFTIKNYITGNGESDANGNFCGGKNWWAKYDAGVMTDGSRTYANVAAGTYNFKVTTGSWDNELGYSVVDLEASDANVWNEEGNNITITTDATSDITISVSSATGKVAVTSTLGRFVRLPYSVVGDPVLGINWEPENTTTEMSRQEDGTYRFILRDCELEAHNGRKFKIVGGHSWSTYQAPTSGDFTVDIPSAGTYDLVFYFDPSTDLATCTPMLHHDVTISAYGYSTFYSDKAFVLPDGLTATIYTNISGTMLTGEAITTIPANTGVVLCGAANATYTLLQTTTDESYPTNLLCGTTTDQEINNSNVHYILGVNNNQCGLFWPNGTNEGVGSFTNAAGKAYLELAPTAAPARVRGFVLSNTDTATAVEQTSTDEEGVCYDLLGRKVAEPQPGNIYIRNGQKIVLF